ncbi:hypothetical protein KIPB_007095 [Kipferlia bialata]|uniref:Uncharacterized protein n=1 Tax=Kipferlia bialata TaxID=797122 RepID=A0A9K3CZT9_9EUKA|nr:hypothetical protein KIPB_007095 [Kipferlia bialata]|eukprot:g7095.t1
MIGTHFPLPKGDDPFSRVCNDTAFLTGVRLATNDIWESVDREPLTGAETLTLQVFVKLMCTAVTAMEIHAVDIVLLSVATRLALRMLVTEDPTLSNTVEVEDTLSLWMGMVTAPSALARCLCSSLVMGGVHYMRQWEEEAVDTDAVDALASAVVSILPTAVARAHDNAWEFYWVCIRDISRIHGVADALVRQGVVWRLLDLIDTHRPRQLDCNECVGSVEGERLITSTDTTSASFDSGPILKAVVKVLSHTTETLSMGVEESTPADSHLTATVAMLCSATCLSTLVLANGDIANVVMSGRFDRGSVLPSQSLLTLHQIDAEGLFNAIAAGDATQVKSWCQSMDALSAAYTGEQDTVLLQDRESQREGTSLIDTVHGVVEGLLNNKDITSDNIVAPLYLSLAKYCLHVGVDEYLHPSGALVRHLLTVCLGCKSTEVQKAVCTLALCSAIGKCDGPTDTYTLIAEHDATVCTGTLSALCNESPAQERLVALMELLLVPTGDASSTPSVLMQYVLPDYRPQLSVEPNLEELGWLLDVVANVHFDTARRVLGDALSDMVCTMLDLVHNPDTGLLHRVPLQESLTDRVLAMVCKTVLVILRTGIPVETELAKSVYTAYTQLRDVLVQSLGIVGGGNAGANTELCALTGLASVTTELLKRVETPLECLYTPEGQMGDTFNPLSLCGTDVSIGTLQAVTAVSVQEAAILRDADTQLPHVCIALEPLFASLSASPDTLRTILVEGGSTNPKESLLRRAVTLFSVYGCDLCQRDQDSVRRQQPVETEYISLILSLANFVSKGLSLFPTCVEDGHDTYIDVLKDVVPKCGKGIGSLIALMTRNRHTCPELSVSVTAAGESMCSHRGNTYKPLAISLSDKYFDRETHPIPMDISTSSKSSQSVYTPLATCLVVGTQRVEASVASGQITPERATKLLSHLHELLVFGYKVAIQCLFDVTVAQDDKAAILVHGEALLGHISRMVSLRERLLAAGATGVPLPDKYVSALSGLVEEVSITVPKNVC